MSSSASVNRDTLLHFLRENQGSEVTLKEAGGALSLTGRLTDFSELDLCGRLLVESELSMEALGLKATLTLHDDLLGVQVSVEGNASPAGFMIAREIPYPRLEIKG